MTEMLHVSKLRESSVSHLAVSNSLSLLVKA